MEVVYTEPSDDVPDAIALGFLHGNLNASDYKVMKHVEGELSDEEFAKVKADRRRWRARINEIEARMEANAGEQ